MTGPCVRVSPKRVQSANDYHNFIDNKWFSITNSIGIEVISNECVASHSKNRKESNDNVAILRPVVCATGFPTVRPYRMRYWECSRSAQPHTHILSTHFHIGLLLRTFFSSAVVPNGNHYFIRPIVHSASHTPSSSLPLLVERNSKIVFITMNVSSTVIPHGRRYWSNLRVATGYSFTTCITCTYTST